MSWQLNEQEFESVLALPAKNRYEYFIKRSASHGELWGLHGVRGWVIAEDDEGKMHFPVWPHRRFAQAFSFGPWEAESPRAIDIDEWVEAWIPQLETEGFRIAVFRTPQDEGNGVPWDGSNAILRRSSLSSGPESDTASVRSESRERQTRPPHVSSGNGAINMR